MKFFITWIVIPVLTIIVSGPGDWFHINFSVVGSMFPQNMILLLWAIVIGCFYHSFTTQTFFQTADFLDTRIEQIMIDFSITLLIASVFLPYQPSMRPIISGLHLIMAFSASVIFFIAVTIADIKLYMVEPVLFVLPTALLIMAIVATIGLLIVCDFLITSALELFLTLFSCFWLQLFDRQISILVKKKRLKFKV